MDGGELPKNLNTFLEEYLEQIGEDAKEIRRDLELIQELDEVFYITQLTYQRDTLQYWLKLIR